MGRGVSNRVIIGHEIYGEINKKRFAYATLVIDPTKARKLAADFELTNITLFPIYK